MLTKPINRNIRNLILGINPELNPVSFSALVVAASVVDIQTIINALPSNISSLINSAQLDFESTATGKAVRYRIDGGVPASGAGNGIPIEDGDTILLSSPEHLSKFKAIQNAAGTHTLNITFFMKPTLN
jgi:hypothetical protein